jgi:hypothetical protein
VGRERGQASDGSLATLSWGGGGTKEKPESEPVVHSSSRVSREWGCGEPIWDLSWEGQSAGLRPW